MRIIFCLLLCLSFSIFAVTPGNSPDYEMEMDAGSPHHDTLFVNEMGDTLTRGQLDSMSATLAIDTLPVLKSFIKASYPFEALKKGLEGIVLFDLFVSDSGKVDSAKVVKGLLPEFDSSAIHAVRQFNFSPARAHGKSVPVIVQYEYRFSVDEEVKAIERYTNLSGLLLEKGTRTPIRDAMVVASIKDSSADTSLHVPWSIYLKRIGSFEGQYLEQGKLVTTTDSLGRFSFQSLPSGKVTLTFPVAGYVSDSVTESLEHGKALTVEYRLERLAYNEYEIVVYGKMEKKEVAKNSLSLAEVKRVPGFGGDAVKVVQALPGVARASFASGQIIVRGSGNGDTRYFLDGVDIPVLFHFGGLRSTYNSDALSAIDLYPGGFNVRYGGCVGGVVEIKGRPAKTDRWHGNVDVNLIDASFLGEGPLSKTLSLMITGRRSYIANVLNAGLKAFGIVLPMTVVPYYWDGVARLDYNPSKADRMFATAFLMQDKMRFIISQVRGGSSDVSDARDALSQDLQAYKAIFGWDHSFDSDTKNELRFSLSHGTQNFNIFGFARMDFLSNGPYIRDQLIRSISDKLNVIAGMDMMAQKVNYTLDILSASGPTRSISSSWFSDIGGYTLAEYKPLKTLVLTPGLRYDYFTELSKGEPSIRFTTRWNYKPKHTLKFAGGTYSQPPQPMGQAIDSVWGNPDLPPTRGRQAVIGYEYQWTDLISADIQTYYNTQNCIPMSAGDAKRPGTDKSYNYLPDQEGRMYGLEVMLRHDPGTRFFGWIAYSLSRSERRSPRPDNSSGGGASATNLNRAWDPNAWNLFSKDQTHNLQLVGSWRLPKNWETGFRLRYVTGNPATPVLGYTEKKYEYNSDYGYYVDLKGKPLSERMGPFFQLDVRVDKKFVYKSWLLSTYLDIQNLNYFVYNSPEFYSYSYDASDRQTIGGIIIPSIGVRAEF